MGRIMRSKGLVISVILGIALILAGIVLAAVPLLSHTGKTITPGIPFTYHVSETVPILSTVPVVVSWSSTAPVGVAMWTCSSFNGNLSTLTTQCPESHAISQSGTSGSATVSVPVGNTLVVAAQSSGGAGGTPSVAISLKSTSSTIGFGLIALGVIVMIAGILLSRGPSAPEPEVSPATTRAPVYDSASAAEPAEPDADEPLDAIG